MPDPHATSNRVRDDREIFQVYTTFWTWYYRATGLRRGLMWERLPNRGNVG